MSRIHGAFGHSEEEAGHSYVPQTPWFVVLTAALLWLASHGKGFALTKYTTFESASRPFPCYRIQFTHGRIQTSNFKHRLMGTHKQAQLIPSCVSIGAER